VKKKRDVKLFTWYSNGETDWIMAFPPKVPIILKNNKIGSGILT